MMEEMNSFQIAAHDAKMDGLRAQMPPDVIQAIRVIANWIDLPDTWDETVDRREAADWWIQRRVNWKKPCAPLKDSPHA